MILSRVQTDKAFNYNTSTREGKYMKNHLLRLCKTAMRLPHRLRRRSALSGTACALAALTVITGAGVSTLAFPSRAQAVEHAAGIQFATAYVGQFRTERDRKTVYCVELYRPVPRGLRELEPQNLTTLPAFTGAEQPISQPAMAGEGLRHLNYVLTKYGSTTDNREAAAVQLAIWKIRAAGLASTHLSNIEREIRDGKEAAVIQRANRMVSEAEHRDYDTVGSHATSPAITMHTPYEGTIRLKANTETVKLQNAVFQKTGSASITFSGGLKTDQTLKIRAQEPTSSDGWKRFFEIKAAGTYRYSILSRTVTVYSPPGNAQRLISVPREKSEIKRKPFQTKTTVDTKWKPVLHTKTPVKRVKKGETFSDTVTFAVADTGAPWRHAYKDGKQAFAQITARGTMYGPYLSDPAKNPAQKAPEGSPVAATAQVTTDPTHGPQTLSVKTSQVSRESGYYTWQWVIDAQDQTTEVRSPRGGEPALPANYRYEDGFGVVTESQYTDMAVNLDTRLSKTEVALAGSINDTVTVSLAGKGGWLQGADGSRIPVVLRGTLYTTQEKPIQQQNVPENAKKIYEFKQVTVSGPDERTVTEPFRVPLDTSGYITAVWCVDEQDQPEALRGLVEETCDEFGVPAETARVLRPSVTTQAQKDATVFTNIHDSATVSGRLPEAQSRILFSAYLLPEVGAPQYSDTWKPLREGADQKVRTWSSEQLDSSDTCALQPVAHTGPVAVARVGDYRSPEVVSRSVGTVYWVETLQAKLERKPPSGIDLNDARGSQSTDEWVTIAEGQCGLPNETTSIHPPKVSTTAVKSAQPGNDISDVAHIEGPLNSIDGGSWQVSFEAYSVSDSEAARLQKTDGDLANACTPPRRVWRSSKPKDVSKPGELKSESFRVSQKHIGRILWVEHLLYTDDAGATQDMHQGTCGAENEITTVADKSGVNPPVAPRAANALAKTSGLPPAWPLIALSAVAMIACAVILLSKRNRKDKEPE
jgi:hypothetical protein